MALPSGRLHTRPKQCSGFEIQRPSSKTLVDLANDFGVIYAECSERPREAEISCETEPNKISRYHQERGQSWTAMRHHGDFLRSRRHFGQSWV